MSRASSTLPRKLVWAAVILLFILHHDFWLWGDRSLVFGFMPVGLFYHVLFSIVASLTWLCAVKFAWPEEIEEWASGSITDAGNSSTVAPGEQAKS
jgi:hypothetical protein